MSSEETDEPVPGPMMTIGKSSRLFASKIYKEVSTGKNGNVLISPLSLQTVLAALHSGAEGETYTEIQCALNFPENKSIVQEGYKKLMEAFNSGEDNTTEVNNDFVIMDADVLIAEYEEKANDTEECDDSKSTESEESEEYEEVESDAADLNNREDVADISDTGDASGVENTENVENNIDANEAEHEKPSENALNVEDLNIEGSGTSEDKENVEDKEDIESEGNKDEDSDVDVDHCMNYNVQLNIANRIYVKKDFEVSKEFQDIAETNFAAGIENVDFNDGVVTAEHINQWVEEKTCNKIKDIIQSNSMDSSTKMILVNALYFKGTWIEQFEIRSTFVGKFYLNKTETVPVEMMYRSTFYQLATNFKLRCRFVKMYYVGQKFAMTIVLPNSKTGLARLETKLHEVLLPQRYEFTNTDLFLPKFIVEETIPMNEILNKLGISKAFTNEADFSGMSANREPLKISEVIQKNFISITEEGTEAASATCAGLMLLCVPQTFRVDRPFLYFIQSCTTGAILYIGRLSIPPTLEDNKAE